MRACAVLLVAVASAATAVEPVPAEPAQLEQILDIAEHDPSSISVQMTRLAEQGGRVCTAHIEPSRTGGTLDLPTVALCGEQRDGVWRWQARTIERATAADRWHTGPAVGIDGDAGLHIAYNLHNAPVQYQRSDTGQMDDLIFRGEPWLPGEFERSYIENRTRAPSAGTGQIPGAQVTYPVFSRSPTGTLWTASRQASIATGTFADRGYGIGVARYADGAWQPIGKISGIATMFAVQAGWTSYQPRIAHRADGRVYVTGFWRRGTSGARITMPWAVTSADGASWTTLDGMPVTLPLRPGDAGLPNGAREHITITDTVATDTGLAMLLAPVDAPRVIARHDGSGWTFEDAPSGAQELAVWRGELWAVASGPRLYRYRNAAWTLEHAGAGFGYAQIHGGDTGLYVHAIASDERAAAVFLWR